jgi:hypothetical protein
MHHRLSRFVRLCSTVCLTSVVCFHCALCALCLHGRVFGCGETSDGATLLNLMKVAMYNTDASGCADVLMRLSKALDVFPSQVGSHLVT